MNSIQKAHTENPKSLSAEISLMIRSHSLDHKMLVVVEGQSDKNFYKTFYKDENFDVYWSSKYSGCLSFDTLLNDLNEKYLQRYIIIKDADFDHLNGKKPVCRNLFLTDTHDIETMMFTDDFAKQTESDYDLQNVKDIIYCAISDIRHLSYIKWMNALRETKLNFDKSCHIGNCYNGSEQIDIETWLDKIYHHPANLNKQIIKSDEVKDFEKDKDIQESDALQLVNGHDFVSAIANKLHHCCNKNISKKEISKSMRRCYTIENYKTTSLCKEINKWLNHIGRPICC